MQVHTINSMGEKGGRKQESKEERSTADKAATD